MDQAALRLTVFAALSLVATAATNAPPVKVVFTSAPPDTFPSTWTGANVRIDFGHTPLQRAPIINQPPVATNAAVTNRAEGAADGSGPQAGAVRESRTRRGRGRSG